jgi:hypothetical protein
MEFDANMNAKESNLLLPLTREQIETLGRFNAECARGIVHTDKWDGQMKELQARFNAEMLASIRE